MSFDILQDKIKAARNPAAAGLDARLEHVPPHILKKYTGQHGETLQAAALAVKEFHCGLIDALRGTVPAVVLRAAGFELLGWRGMQALEEIIAHAKGRGLYVIADVNRGDVGTAAAASAGAWLGAAKIGEAECPVFDADCVTLNGYLGSDAIRPFLAECAARNKAAFVLVKTPNPSSTEFQDLVAGDRFVYNVMGDLAERLGRDVRGKYGFGALGAVAGAARPNTLKELRRRLPNTFFLVPDCGAQGITADGVRHAFTELGRGAVICAYSFTCAWQNTGKDGGDYQEAALATAEQLRDELKKAVTIL